MLLQPSRRAYQGYEVGRKYWNILMVVRRGEVTSRLLIPRAPGRGHLVGHFTGSNKGLTQVYYDIGGPAGAYASRNAANSFSERIVEGARVWTAKKDWPDGKGGRTVLVAVTFPDSGCANFYLKSPKNEDAAVIDFIAQSFHPNGPIQPSSLCH